MVVRKGESVEIEVEKVAFGGRGIARRHGFVLFVRGGLPGDRVLARVYRKKKDFAEARVLEVLSPSPDRIDPPCPYTGACGGCQWQHARYPRQLVYKTALVREFIGQLPGLSGAVVRDTIPSERQLGYRNKMEFSFSDRRWFLQGELHRKAQEGGFALGLHVPGTFDKVLDVDACLLQRPEGNRILRTVKTFARQSGLPAYGLKTHQGFWRFLALRHSAALDRWLVNIITREENPGVLHALADLVRERHPGVIAVVHNPTRRLAAVAVGEREIVLSGQEALLDRLGPFTFRVSANSFFQTNPPVAERIYAQVLAFAEPSGHEEVLDLYSGTGTIPIYLSRAVGRVTGIEISEPAVRDAAQNCRENGIDNCRFLCGDIRQRLSEIPSKPDLVIIDPPRAGMHPAVTEQVAALAAPKVIYVSCNPATLARDLAVLTRDYELAAVQPFDMFPHTYHVEAVALLRLKEKRPAGSSKNR